MKEKDKKKIFCVYCGVEISRRLKNETKDHVPPLSFYEPPVPPNLKTVPACKKCNNEERSGLDEYIRAIFTFRHDVVESNEFPHLVSKSTQ
ncbi:MAG: HNH endonuclease [Ignavibacteria bacterium]|nr:HNH endonuclease [Ignavibacteria bacterium]